MTLGVVVVGFLKLEPRQKKFQFVHLVRALLMEINQKLTLLTRKPLFHLPFT
jgi:hypothetical protein